MECILYSGNKEDSERANLGFVEISAVNLATLYLELGLLYLNLLFEYLTFARALSPTLN